MKQDYLNKPDFLKIPEDPFDQNTKINNPKNNPINKKFDNIDTQMKEFKNFFSEPDFKEHLKNPDIPYLPR